MTRKAWLAAHINAVKSALALRGIAVGNSLLGAYRSFLRDDGSLTLRLAPQDQIDLHTLHLYSIQNAMTYLAPALTVNGKRIKKLDLASITPNAAPVPRENVAAIPGDNVQYSYRTIPLNMLRLHVGERVRLTTDSRHVFAGKLDSVGGRIATVDVNSYYDSDKEIVLLTRVAKTEVATSLKQAKSGAL